MASSWFKLCAYRLWWQVHELWSQPTEQQCWFRSGILETTFSSSSTMGDSSETEGWMDDVPWSVLAAVSNMRPPMKEPLLMELAAQFLV